MTRRGQYAKGAAKRAEILAVALEVVAEQGTRKSSNREIASRVGLTQPGLMHYFRTREDLFVEVLRARDARDHEQYYSADHGFQSFLDVIAHNATVPGLVRLYVEYSAEATIEGHAARAFFEERFRWVRTLMIEAIEVEQAAERMGPDVDAPYAADLIIAAADGLQVQWLLDPSIDMAARLSRLWEGIRAASWAPVGA